MAPRCETVLPELPELQQQLQWTTFKIDRLHCSARSSRNHRQPTMTRRPTYDALEPGNSVTGCQLALTV
jgi:hypothetical protein